MEAVETLLRTTMFRDVLPRDVEELLPHVRPVSFARGESVWNEGDPSTALYVVVEGQLKAYRVGSDGTEVILKLVSRGEVTGEPGLFHPTGVRQVCVAAMQASRCLTVPREPLLAFMTKHPPVMLRMLQNLSELTVRAAYSFSEVAFEDIRRRVARTLVQLADEHGERTASGLRIGLKLSQSTLAAMVAASRENVNRALSLFFAGGTISQRDGYFFVHDRKALEQEVGSAP